MPAKINISDSKVRDLYDGGKTANQIAAQLEVSECTVLRSLKRTGGSRSNSEAIKLSFKLGREPQRYWLGKQFPEEAVKKRAEKIKGSNHYLWKGGIHNRDYRNVKSKECCELCGSRLNLGIHHKDTDHYNNSPDNLQVLCVSCHISIHKKEYWAAKKLGLPTPKSNGPVGWGRKKK